MLALLDNDVVRLELNGFGAAQNDVPIVVVELGGGAQVSVGQRRMQQRVELHERDVVLGRRGQPQAIMRSSSTRLEGSPRRLHLRGTHGRGGFELMVGCMSGTSLGRP